MCRITVNCKASEPITLSLTTTKTNEVILLPITGHCTCQPCAVVNTAPARSTRLLFLIGRPQPFQYFARATLVLQALTARDFRHLQCFSAKPNKCLIFNFVHDVLGREDTLPIHLFQATLDIKMKQ